MTLDERTGRLSAVTDRALETAANWWFDKMVDAKHDTGDQGFASFVTGAMADKLAEQYPVTEKQREPFRTAFVKCIHQCLMRGHGVKIGCDYGPCRTLLSVMDDAGIAGCRAPWKTHMYIAYGSAETGIAVIDGYAAPHERLCDLDGVAPTERFIVEYEYLYDHMVEAGVAPKQGNRTVYSLSEVEQVKSDLAQDKDETYRSFRRQVMSEGEWRET
jgi:hypothetical protein